MPDPSRPIAPVRWSRPATRQWDQLIERAPTQAAAVYRAIDWLAKRPQLPELGHRDPEGRRRRVWHVPPQAVFYRFEKGQLVVLEIQDSRRRRKPW
jgi:plasmid stabilization system protein ParE